MAATPENLATPGSYILTSALSKCMRALSRLKINLAKYKVVNSLICKR